MRELAGVVEEARGGQHRRRSALGWLPEATGDPLASGPPRPASDPL